MSPLRRRKPGLDAFTQFNSYIRSGVVADPPDHKAECVYNTSPSNRNDMHVTRPVQVLRHKAGL